jgi:hypothetical protein
LKKLLQEKGGAADPKAGPTQQQPVQTQQNIQQNGNNIPPVKIE